MVIAIIASRKIAASRIATQSRRGFFSSGASQETGAVACVGVSHLPPVRHASATTAAPMTPAGTTYGNSAPATSGFNTELITRTRGTRTVHAATTPAASAAAAVGN